MATPPPRPTTTTTRRSARSPTSKPPTALPSSFPDSTTGHVTAERAGTVRFTLGGEPVSLSMFWLLDYAGGFFLSYRDATCGRETYGAGRYLLDTAKGADLGADARWPADARLQLRLPAVVQLRPALELSAAAA